MAVQIATFGVHQLTQTKLIPSMKNLIFLLALMALVSRACQNHKQAARRLFFRNLMANGRWNFHAGQRYDYL